MAQVLNLQIDQGASFSTSFQALEANGSPMDFTSASANAQIRKHSAANTSVSITVTLGSNGNITLTLAANAVANLVGGNYLYDVLVTKPSGTIRVREGHAFINPSITR